MNLGSLTIMESAANAVMCVETWWLAIIRQKEWLKEHTLPLSKVCFDRGRNCARFQRAVDDIHHYGILDRQTGCVPVLKL